MKFLLIVAAVVAMAVAGPTRRDAEYEPIHVGPALVEDYQPIQIGPAIVEDYHPIHIGPAIVEDFHPIHVGPEIVDFPVVDVPAPIAPIPAPSSSPLVQIIVNVNQQGGSAAPVQVDTAEESTPVHVVEEAEEHEVIPTPVIVVEHNPEEFEPVIVAPIQVVPAVVEPEILN